MPTSSSSLYSNGFATQLEAFVCVQGLTSNLQEGGVHILQVGISV